MPPDLELSTNLELRLAGLLPPGFQTLLTAPPLSVLLKNSECGPIAWGHQDDLLFKKYAYYFFIFRGGKEGEGGEEHRRAAPFTCPRQGPGPQPSMCPDRELNPQPSW